MEREIKNKAASVRAKLMYIARAGKKGKTGDGSLFYNPTDSINYWGKGVSL